MKAILTLIIQKPIKVKGNYNHEEDEFPKAYYKKRDGIVRAMETKGWNVTIEDEELQDQDDEDYVPSDMHCEDCGKQGRRQECPYAAEIHSDYTLHVLCDNCAARRAQDI